MTGRAIGLNGIRFRGWTRSSFRNGKVGAGRTAAWFVNESVIAWLFPKNNPPTGTVEVRDALHFNLATRALR